jgi:hypothetical protein
METIAEWLPRLGAVLVLLIGVLGFFKPTALTDSLGIQLSKPIATSEARAVFGGINLGGALLALYFHDPLVYTTLGLITPSQTFHHRLGAPMSLPTEDTIEILQLYARYNTAIDTGDHDGFAACFVAQGHFDSGMSVLDGQDAIAGFAKLTHENMPTMRHNASNIVVDGQGDTAHGPLSG